jgi:hypothetical protein|tara:strand:+ start:3523 stop:3756 length:234 start_codon:yes stop_codon:yes gene_type:complete
MDKTRLLKALQSQYQGQMDIALANIEVYIHNPAGIGEHPDLAAALDTQIEALTSASEKHDTVSDLIKDQIQTKTLVG